MLLMLLLPILAVPLVYSSVFRHSYLGGIILQKRLLKTPTTTPSYLYGIADTLSYKLGEYLMITIYLIIHWVLMLTMVSSHGRRVGMSERRRGWAVATGFGSLGNIMMVLLPISKTTVWVHLLGISFERAIKFHR